MPQYITALGTESLKEAFPLATIMLHTEKYFRILVKSNPNQIVFAPIDLEQQTDSVRLLFQINQKMVNTIPDFGLVYEESKLCVCAYKENFPFVFPFA